MSKCGGNLDSKEISIGRQQGGIRRGTMGYPFSVITSQRILYRIQRNNGILRFLKSNSKSRIPIQYFKLNNNDDNLRKDKGLTEARV